MSTFGNRKQDRSHTAQGGGNSIGGIPKDAATLSLHNGMLTYLFADGRPYSPSSSGYWIRIRKKLI